MIKCNEILLRQAIVWRSSALVMTLKHVKRRAREITIMKERRRDHLVFTKSFVYFHKPIQLNFNSVGTRTSNFIAFDQNTPSHLMGYDINSPAAASRGFFKLHVKH